MTSFNDRERAFETKFAHDNEVAFRVNARKTKEFGRLAAEWLGKSGTLAEAYAHDLVMDSLQNSSESAVLTRVMNDLSNAGCAVTEKEARIALAKCAERARAQLN